MASKPLAADTFEKILAMGAIALLTAMLVALAKGQSEWGRLPVAVGIHLGTIGIALALTPVMLLRRRGDQPHRHLGRIWVGAMLATAIVSFFVRSPHNGGWSPIHLLSVWVTIQVPLIYWSAKTHNIKRHRGAVRGMVLGALLIAGFFTFPFNRQLGQWLFS